MTKFVIVFNDDTVAAVPESRVSNMYDMADCDAMDNVRAVYAVDESGKLVPIRIGPQNRLGYVDSEYSLYYANAPIYAGKKTVGFIHLTDH